MKKQFLVSAMGVSACQTSFAHSGILGHIHPVDIVAVIAVAALCSLFFVAYRR